MQEEWRPVVGYEGLFEVSDEGRVYSLRTDRILKQTVSKTGYYTIATKIGGRSGKAVCFKVHRLVAEAFHQNPHNFPCVNHKDGNKLNNTKNNVEWCTYKQNSEHAYATGLAKGYKGEESTRAKLTEEDILYIRSHYIPNDKTFGCRALASTFCVHHSNIYLIVHRKNWDCVA